MRKKRQQGYIILLELGCEGVRAGMKKEHIHTSTQSMRLPCESRRELMAIASGEGKVKRGSSFECQKFDHVYSLRNGS